MGKFVTMFSEDRHNFRAGQNDTLMESVLAKAIKPGFAFELSPSPPIKQTIKCQVAASWDPGVVTGREQGLAGDEWEPRAPVWTLVCQALGTTCTMGPVLLAPGRTAGAAAC